eukprot:NODE_551_length_6164_cov_0.432811.p9 type:complete len:115 gc:universal NODE_551_length_6164_cov_0.432811:3051-2707(-)
MPSPGPLEFTRASSSPATLVPLASDGAPSAAVSAMSVPGSLLSLSEIVIVVAASSGANNTLFPASCSAGNEKHNVKYNMINKSMDLFKPFQIDLIGVNPYLYHLYAITNNYKYK